MSHSRNFHRAEALTVDARAGQRVNDSNPLQLSACPWCGRELDLARDVDADNGWDRTLLYCPDPEGDCPFTKAKAEGEGIPIVTVDEELYRLLPAFFIAMTRPSYTWIRSVLPSTILKCTRTVSPALKRGRSRN